VMFFFNLNIFSLKYTQYQCILSFFSSTPMFINP
jgi:hypothetical protein